MVDVVHNYSLLYLFGDWGVRDLHDDVRTPLSAPGQVVEHGAGGDLGRGGVGEGALGAVPNETEVGLPYVLQIIWHGSEYSSKTGFLAPKTELKAIN